MIDYIKKFKTYPILVVRKYQSWQNARRLKKITGQLSGTGKKTKILFGPSFSVYHTLKIHDILLTSILTAKGANISYLSNAYRLQACLDCGGINQEISGEINSCSACQRFTRNDADLVNHIKNFANILNIGKFLNKHELDEINKTSEAIPSGELIKFVYDEIPIGEYSSLIVRNLNYVDDINLVPDYQPLLRSTILTNLLFYRYFQAAIKVEKPDIIVTHEAFYTPWKLLYDLAKKNGIAFYNYYPGMRDNTFFYVKGKVAFDLEDMGSLYSKWEDKPINEKELNKINIFFKQRKKSNIYDIQMTTEKDDTELLHYNEILKSKRPLAVLYTNVLWDVASLYKERVFSSVQESILETIKFFINHSQYNLVVKPHPADMLQGHESNEQVVTLIKKNFSQLPRNILVLNPKSTISSYDLIDKSNISIVHTTTVGMESAILGKPTITLGKAHYTDKGFTYDPSDKNEFAEILTNILDKKISVDHLRQREQARKYYYLLNFVLWYDFGIIKFNFKARSKAMVRPRSLPRLLKLKEFNQLAEAIINKQDVPFFDQDIEA